MLDPFSSWMDAAFVIAKGAVILSLKPVPMTCASKPVRDEPGFIMNCLPPASKST
jgi:hypothetical protein